MRRLGFIALCVSAACSREAPLSPIIVKVNVMLDNGPHAGKGLTPEEAALFQSQQQACSREYAASGIQFDLHFTEGAYLRRQGNSVIPEKFLVKDRINLFVTDSLGYDVDRHRTGGSSIGPHPQSGVYPADPYFKSFLGLHEASAKTLAHEYAHHFTLDTSRNVVGAANLWADLRNDYWLWRQQHGSTIGGFRACAKSIWVK